MDSPLATTVSPEARASGAATGAFIGDALAMPAHWYYDREALRAEFGVVDSYRAPPAVHPNSILWRSTYEPTEPEFDILGDERPYWGQRGVHYHRNLRPGENTLNLKLVRAVLELDARNTDALRGVAVLGGPSGENQASLDAWRTLLSGYRPGSESWFEARTEHLKVLSRVDRERAKAVLRQHSVLYPDLGPEPQATELRELAEQLGVELLGEGARGG